MGLLPRSGKNIREVFNTMSYESKLENLTSLKKWINGVDNFTKYIELSDGTIPGETADITNVNTGQMLAQLKCLSNISILNFLQNSTNECSISSADRRNFLIRFSEELETNSKLICEIDVALRGILTKDTQEKVLPYMVGNLKYCASRVESCEGNNRYYSYLGNDIFLAVLGYCIGEALMKGCCSYLFVRPQMSVAAALFRKICLTIGIPEYMITIIPLHDSIEFEPYVIGQRSALLHEVSKIPMIVFNNADLDSACATAIDAMWGYQGLLPWAVNMILVQEDILNDFTDKLEIAVKKITMGQGNNVATDIAFPASASALDKLNVLKQRAALLGVKVIQKKGALKSFKPTLFVGGRVYGNSVLSRNSYQDIPHGTVLSFRNANEAVDLANNLKQGLAASVWTENIGLANEMAKKLRVTNVWINSYGHFPLNLPIVPYEPENMQTQVKIDDIGVVIDKNVFKSDQKIWAKLTHHERMSKLQMLGVMLKISGISSKFLSALESSISKAQFKILPISESDKYTATAFYTPKSFIIMSMKGIGDDELELCMLETIFGVLLNGSAVVLLLSNYDWMLTAKMLQACNIPPNLIIIKKHVGTNAIQSLYSQNVLCPYKKHKNYVSEMNNIKIMWQS